MADGTPGPTASATAAAAANAKPPHSSISTTPSSVTSLRGNVHGGGRLEHRHHEGALRDAVLEAG